MKSPVTNRATFYAAIVGMGIVEEAASVCVELDLAMGMGVEANTVLCFRLLHVFLTIDTSVDLLHAGEKSKLFAPNC